MNLKDYLRKKFIQFLGIEHLTENPKGERFTYLTNEEELIRKKIIEYKAWYSGDSDELLNFYTQDKTHNVGEAIYNRNKKNYFWSLSSTEANIKRVHSGIPNAIVSTLVNAIGNPKITSTKQDEIDKIIENNELFNVFNQQQMPLTMALGYGAFKVDVDNSISKTPIIEYYDAEYVEYIVQARKLIGIVYKDYYKYNNHDYLLLETRRTDGKNSYIEFELFKLNNQNEAEPVELSEVPELSNLQNLVIENFPFITGVASVYFYDVYNRNYGKSLYAGKIDLFDDLDQDLSQNSQSVKLSTPIEYIPADLCKRDKVTGDLITPQVYSRKFLPLETAPNGDGETNGEVRTTQAQLNIGQYSENARMILDFILTGILSPATMGIDIAKKDNAEAQREKEKVTIMTRNNIIERQTKIIKELLKICLAFQEYQNSGTISLDADYDIKVIFNEFANPSFENQLQTLGNAWVQGEISTKKYVELLWGDKLTEQEKQIEIAWLDNNKAKDNLTFTDLGVDLDAKPITSDNVAETDIIE